MDRCFEPRLDGQAGYVSRSTSMISDRVSLRRFPDHFLFRVVGGVVGHLVPRCQHNALNCPLSIIHFSFLRPFSIVHFVEEDPDSAGQSGEDPFGRVG
jgi:hypothetical protein